jgi:hypothetical protein
MHQASNAAPRAAHGSRRSAAGGKHGAYRLDPVTPRSARLPRLVCVSPTCVYAAIGQHGPLWVTPDLCVPHMRTTMAPGRGRYGQRIPVRLLLLLLLPPCLPLLAQRAPVRAGRSPS